MAAWASPTHDGGAFHFRGDGDQRSDHLRLSRGARRSVRNCIRRRRRERLAQMLAGMQRTIWPPHFPQRLLTPLERASATYAALPPVAKPLAMISGQRGTILQRNGQWRLVGPRIENDLALKWRDLQNVRFKLRSQLHAEIVIYLHVICNAS